jgi:signal transduction histidine kinase
VKPAEASRLHFRIDAQTPAGSHPVEAHCEALPGGYWMLVGTDTSEREATLRRFGIATLWGVGLTTALVLVLGWRYSRRTAQRVRAFADTCDSIIHGDLSRRLAVSGARDEFDALGGTVNAMLDQLEQQAGTLRATLGSVAHDLRTPLYRLRMRLEESMLEGAPPIATPELVAPAIRELDRVQHTLGVMLEIARAQAGAGDRTKVQVDLSQLASEMGELYAPGLHEHDIGLQVDIEPELLVAGNRQLLAQMIANLLENVLRHVPSGGHVRLAMAREEGTVVLTIADNGPGIAETDRARALQPFVRLRATTTGEQGSGLGLSLVAAIARLHGAVLDLDDNRPGLRVRCRFPTG